MDEVEFKELRETLLAEYKVHCAKQTTPAPKNRGKGSFGNDSSRGSGGSSSGMAAIGEAAKTSAQADLLFAEGEILNAGKKLDFDQKKHDSGLEENDKKRKHELELEERESKRQAQSIEAEDRRDQRRLGLKTKREERAAAQEERHATAQAQPDDGSTGRSADRSAGTYDAGDADADAAAGRQTVGT